MRSIRGLALLGTFLCGISGSSAFAQQELVNPAENCDTETLQKMAPADTTVAFAAREGDDLCRVVGYVTTQNPGPNKVLFTLGLPSRFTGRYVYVGVGGAAGNLPQLRPELLAKGYAVGGSDGGSGSKNWSDFSFRSDPGRQADFLGRGVHVVAKATQDITRAYYNRPKIFRYISGCSGGGQMGLTNALRFGAENFDGFVIGATPLIGKTVYGINAFRLAQHLQNHPEAWISPDQLKQVDAAILAAYDESDGAKDGIIADQRNIAKFDENILRQAGLTPAQIAMFNMIRTPQPLPRAGGGTMVQPGYPITDVEYWAKYFFGSSPPPWPNTQSNSASYVMMKGAPYFHVMADTNTRVLEPGTDYAKLKLERLARIANEMMGKHPYIPDSTAALNKFAGSGGRIIIYHGVDDEAMSYLENVKNHQELVKEHPDADKWLRLYVMPGLRHCRGGPGTSNSEEPLIEAVANWVEKGQAPQEVIARRETIAKGYERNFLLCPEPRRAFLKAPGADATKAENWECRDAGREE
jgi:feruloyl esterase